jgi:hypothetical protein
MIHIQNISDTEMLDLYPFTDSERPIIIDFGSVSRPLFAGWWEDQLLGFAGLALVDGNLPYLWAYMTAAAADHSVAVALRTRRFIAYILRQHPIILGNCSPKNIRWSQLCLGAEVIGTLGPQLTYKLEAAA